MKTLYISDLDGTLLNNEAEISEKSVNLLNKFILKGNFFTVATARTAASVVKMLAKVSINIPVVLMNGVASYDICKKEYINVHFFGENAKKRFISLIREFGSPGFVYCIDNHILSTYYENTSSPNAKTFIKEREDKFGKRFYKVESFNNCLDLNIVYYSYSDVYKELKPLYDKVKDIPDVHTEFYHDTYNTDFWYLEVCSNKASKYNAVNFLKAKYGFERAVGFGDNLNDISLFAACEESYAVENAKDAVKNKATSVIGKNTENAVAEFLSKI